MGRCCNHDENPIIYHAACQVGYFRYRKSKVHEGIQIKKQNGEKDQHGVLAVPLMIGKVVLESNVFREFVFNLVL